MARGFARLARFRRWLVVGAAVLVTGAVHARMDTTAKLAGGERFVPDPAHASLWSLGFDSLLGDYYWLQTLQLVGEEQGRTERHAPLIARLLEVVTALDPWVDHPYRFAALWLVDSPQSVQRANALLERGIAYHPFEWRNHYYLGFNHFYWLEDQQRAADVLEGAVALEGSPRYLGALVARLRASVDGLEIAASFLAELARTSPDEYARAEYGKALDEIETERRARLLDRARTEFQRRRGRDLGRVEELLLGPQPVLSALPPPHPVFPGFAWEIDGESGEIVSSFYGTRYRLHHHPLDHARRTAWRSAP